MDLLQNVRLAQLWASREPCSFASLSTSNPSILRTNGQSSPRLHICSASTTQSARTSLIPETLEELAKAPQIKQQTAAQQAREERRRRQRSLDSLGVPSFDTVLRDAQATELARGTTHILQLNIGLYCNQACSHCHVESSPLRTEMMDRRTAVRCLHLARGALGDELQLLDITGGAPELNPEFRFLVEQAHAMGLTVIDRCNLTVLLEPGQEDLVGFLAEHRVRVVASLPCYSPANVDSQRGSGVFQRSIQGLQMLNAAGYGQAGSGLQLDLVYNPNGAFLAPAQATLEDAYKQELQQAYGIVFNNLLCLNNMPIKRFTDYLLRQGKLEDYMQLLVNSFNIGAAEHLMCRDTVSVGWDGRLYDCDFNQQLEMGLRPRNYARSRGATVFDIGSLAELQGARIAVDNHCFGCTAGSGSGCQGATGN